MRWLDLIFAGRPLLHLPVWSIYLVSLHYHHALSGESVQPRDLLVLIALSLLAAGAYYLNQVYDRESDARNGKLGFFSDGLLSERALLIAYIVTSLIPLVIAAMISWQLLFFFTQLFVLGYLYSAPPFRLKDRPILGLIANAYSYGFLIPFTVMPEFTEHTASLLGWDNPFYFFCAVGSIYLLTTLPDRDGDRATGKRTLAVVWSAPAVKLLALALMAAAAVIAFRSGHAALVLIALVSLFPILLTLLVPLPAAERTASKLPILALTILAGWYAPVYFIFVVALVFASRVYYLRRFNLVYPRLS